MGGGGSRTQTIGYKYLMGIHMIVCHGPIDSIEDIYAGERSLLPTGVSYIFDGNETVRYIDKPNLFGGAEQEGGVQGYLDIMFGDMTQGQNAYLASVGLSPLPAFRGVVSLVGRQMYVCAMAPYPKPWWVKCKRIPQKDWYVETADINTGSANGVHIIRETILNEDWGMGYPYSQIDDVSFRAAALTCYNENIGLSLLMAGQTQCEEFIQQILRHINGILITDKITGLFKIKLIRDDYTVGDLPLFNEDNIIAVESYQRPGYGELVNEVVLVFRERGDTSDSVVTLQDLASIQAQGGIISQTVQFPGIDNRNNAALIAQRELKQRTIPLAKATLKVNREGWDLEPGDVIRFSWDAYGITDMALRISKIDYGNILNGAITLECVEDVFGLPETTYSDPQENVWSDPVIEPIAIASADTKLIEVPYFDFATLTTYDFVLDELGETDTSIQVMAVPGGNVAYGFELWAKLDSESNYVFRTNDAFTPAAFLGQDITETDQNDIELGVYDVSIFDDDFDCLYAYIEDEVVRVDTLTAPSGPDPAKITIGRGCLDTLPAKHLSGTRIWFAHNNALWDPTEYQETTTIDCKLLAQTSIGTFDLASATAEQIGPLQARHNLPYPPANVLLGPNSASFPTNIYGSDATDVSWVDRNRLQQTTTSLLDFFDGGITVEPSVTYTLRFLGEQDYAKDPFTAASKETTGLASGSYSWGTEFVDAPLRNYSPQRNDQDLYMAFGDNEIGGTLSDETNVPDSSNVTYDALFGAATFSAGWMDLGNWSPSNPWSISFLFNPDGADTGDDYQLLFSKPVVSGGGGADNIAIYWRLSDYQLYAVSNGSAPVLVPDSYCPPEYEHAVIAIRQTTGYLKLILNGTERTSGAITWNGSTNTTLDWTLGGAWQSGTSTRYRLFSGTIKDLRFFDGVEIALADMFPVGDRVNRFFRTHITAVRAGINSYQSFDFTCPNRSGWGLQYNLNWNGREE
jgi:hypothetical protein